MRFNINHPNHRYLSAPFGAIGTADVEPVQSIDPFAPFGNKRAVDGSNLSPTRGNRLLDQLSIEGHEVE